MKRFISILLAFILIPAIALADFRMQVVDDPADPRVVVSQDGKQTVIRPEDRSYLIEYSGQTIVIVTNTLTPDGKTSFGDAFKDYYGVQTSFSEVHDDQIYEGIKNADVIVLFSTDLSAISTASWPDYVFFCTSAIPRYSSSSLYKRTVFGCTAFNGTIYYSHRWDTFVSADFYYVCNANTGKFHKGNCSSVDQMAEKNKRIMFDWNQAVARGFVPCKRCKP